MLPILIFQKKPSIEMIVFVFEDVRTNDVMIYFWEVLTIVPLLFMETIDYHEFVS